MRQRGTTVLSYPHAPGHRPKRPPPVDLPVPGLGKLELLVVLGIIAALLAILVPVVHTVRENARRAVELERQRTSPAMNSPVHD